ncbi:MAG: hypothetical protein WC373_03560 [Smithella sp.]|jgi:hypothetical protein
MQVSLTNQEVVKFAYITKETIDYAWGAKLSNAQANCYQECFYTIQDLLEEVDNDYLKKHRDICDFFLTGKRLTNENNILKWEKEWESDKMQPNIKPKKRRK